VAGNGFHISQKWIIFWESEMVNALVYAAEPIGIKRRYFFMQVMAAGNDDVTASLFGSG